MTFSTEPPSREQPQGQESSEESLADNWSLVFWTIVFPPLYWLFPTATLWSLGIVCGLLALASVVLLARMFLKGVENL
jgi:hypothetical protein